MFRSLPSATRPARVSFAPPRCSSLWWRNRDQPGDFIISHPSYNVMKTIPTLFSLAKSPNVILIPPFSTEACVPSQKIIDPLPEVCDVIYWRPQNLPLMNDDDLISEFKDLIVQLIIEIAFKMFLKFQSRSLRRCQRCSGWSRLRHVVRWNSQGRLSSRGQF